MESSGTIHDFAEQNGVTVRALQHYDRLGLLCPRRSPAGYRRYSKADSGRLQQIQALQWVGLSLKEIVKVLDDESLDVTETLNQRRAQLEEQRKRLDDAITAIQQAGLLMPGGTPPSRQHREQIIHVIGLNRAIATVEAHPEFSNRMTEVCRKSDFLGGHTSEEIEQMKKESADLFRDAEAASDQNPAGPEGRSIAARYRRLLAQQCHGDPHQLATALDLHRKIPVFPAGLGLESRMENFSNTAWVFLGKALAASEG